MPPLSIRLRLTFWYALVLLLGMGLFATGVWFRLERRLMDDIDRELAQRVDGLRVVTQIEGEKVSRSILAAELEEFTREVPDGSWIAIRDHMGRLLPLSGVLVFPESLWRTPQYQTIDWRGRSLRVLSRTYEDRGEHYTAVVASPLDSLRAVMKELRILAIATIPAVLLLAGLGGYWLSRRALAPVDAITQVARSISAQNLSSRLAVPQTGDELQRMSEAWNDVLQRLESALEQIRRFTADASHELRTPIALIQGTAELALRRERDREEYRAALREIHAQAQQMTDLTDSLLTLARADAVGVDLPLAKIDINQLVLETVAQTGPLTTAKRMNLAVHLPTQPTFIRANHAAIRRLLLILIDNAMKYTSANGQVDIDVIHTDKEVRLSVSDSGIGMDPAILPHIFERFYRADPARSLEGGAGLGLPIAQMIAHAHGASIEAHSTPGQGSCFHLAFKSIE